MRSTPRRRSRFSKLNATRKQARSIPQRRAPRLFEHLEHRMLLAITYPAQADQFIDAIGINTHVLQGADVYGGETASPANEARFDLVVAALQSLGIRHLRDQFIPDKPSIVFDRVNELASLGFRHQTSTYNEVPADQMATLLAPIAGAIEGVEGINEPNNFRWWLSAQQIVDYQEDLYNNIKNSANLNHIPVYAPALGNANNPAQWAQNLAALNIAQFADYANVHPYPEWFVPETASTIANYIANAQTVTPGKPMFSTETGEITIPPDQGAGGTVTEATAGKYMPRLILDQLYTRNLKRTYIYELFDRDEENDPHNPTENGDNYGLYRHDGVTLKPSGWAVKNMLALIRDDSPPGVTFQTMPLDYSLTGANIRHKLFQQRDGDYYLAVWFPTDANTGEATSSVTLTVNNLPISSAYIYKNLDTSNMSGSGALTFSGNNATFQLGNEVLIIKLAGGLPGPWSHQDVGSPATKGTATAAPMFASLIASGAGTGIGGASGTGTTDQFQFAYQPFDGNSIAVTRVNPLTGQPSGTKAGLMYRDSTANNAKFVDLVRTPSGAIKLEYRAATGGAVVSTTIGTVPTNVAVWLQLARGGNGFLGSYSTNGTTWSAPGGAVVTMADTANVGVAVTSASAGSLATATFALTQVTDIFTDTNIGNPGQTGTQAYDPFTDTYTVTGGGADIFGTSDQFNFAHKGVATPGGVVFAQLTEFTASDVWAKAGVMWRDSTAANAPYVAVLYTRSNGIAMQWRSTAGAATNVILAPGITINPLAPLWLRVRRLGNGVGADYFQGLGRPSESDWKPVTTNAVTVNFTGNGQAGLAVTARNNNQLATAKFKNVDPHGIESDSSSFQSPALLSPAPLFSAEGRGRVRTVNGVARPLRLESKLRSPLLTDFVFTDHDDNSLEQRRSSRFRRGDAFHTELPDSESSAWAAAVDAAIE